MDQMATCQDNGGQAIVKSSGRVSKDMQVTSFWGSSAFLPPHLDATLVLYAHCGICHYVILLLVLPSLLFGCSGSEKAVRIPPACVLSNGQEAWYPPRIADSH